ncbi:hypothetical protein I7I53_02353 [Histoplasma capsulatum var. duboisii H88]|uniref:Uncharacterized protein n=1 Tax=Ajellomyces capsulatus (strain H88) TaxID=544711 RepID=A0A8A1LRS0_AJEC8|nr:hypothetical protein I7I53_02353 [Histoplasma capsulatum var. duboisii H88]
MKVWVFAVQGITTRAARACTYNILTTDVLNRVHVLIIVPARTPLQFHCVVFWGREGGWHGCYSLQ